MHYAVTQYVIILLQRIGYLAASQCFHESTDVIMLTTNQIRKVSDFCRSVPSINCYSSLCQLFLSHRFFLFLSFFFLRISAVPTSMTRVLPSLASLVLSPLIWLETWPMTLWHWWAMENVSRFTKKNCSVVFSPQPLFYSSDVFVYIRSLQSMVLLLLWTLSLLSFFLSLL